MGAPGKYPELKERATRLAIEARHDPESRTGAIKRIAEQLGIHPEALHTWVRQAEIDGGVCPVRPPTRRNASPNSSGRTELRRANDILKTDSAFSRQRSSTAHSVIADYIVAHNTD